MLFLRSFAPFVIGVALLLAAGCQDAASGDGAIEASRVSNGAQQAVTCDLTAVATSSSSPDALFSLITDLDVDSEGNIYVGDRDKPGITVLSGDGAVLRRIGRGGEGPGEFKWVGNVRILPGDSLMVYDFGLNRVTVFLPKSDEVAYVTNLAATSSLEPPFSAEKIPGQRAILAAYRQAYRASDDPAEDQNRKQVLRLLNADGSVQRDSVLVVPSNQNLVVRRGDIISSAGEHPFRSRPVVEVGPDGRIYYGSTDSLAIGIFSLQGQQVGGFSAPYESAPITDEDVEDVYAAHEESWANTFGRALEESTPETWPAFKNFVVDDRGRIWVGLITPTGEPTRWVAFNDSGARVCSATLPENVEIKLIRDRRAYGVATDELDVPRVVVYEIGEQGAGEVAS